MRAVMSLVSLVALSQTIVFGSEKTSVVSPIPADKWDLGFLSKELGLQLKTISYTAGRGTIEPSFELLIHFSKDVPKPSMLTQLFPSKGTSVSNPPLRFYCFDADNVVIEKSDIYSISEGEITGKKGDAFRLRVVISSKSLARTKKVEVRPVRGTGSK